MFIRVCVCVCVCVCASANMYSMYQHDRHEVTFRGCGHIKTNDYCGPDIRQAAAAR